MVQPVCSNAARDKFLHDFGGFTPKVILEMKGFMAMQVQVNTGNGIENKETLERWAAEYLNGELARFKNEITRIEVQLSAESKARNSAADN
jgi:hypothetical protein